ncbi:MAG: HAD family phosphatase [Deinococcus sp.]|nr:HAD family phosphatase [Deinococcus sp.]
MAIRLVVSDVDGTLLAPDHSITPRVRTAVARATEQGIKVALASARPPQGLVWLLAELGIGPPFVSFNGALVMGASGQIVERHIMVPGTAQQVLALAQQYHLTPNVYVGQQWYVPWMDELVAEEARAVHCQPTAVNDLEKLLAPGVEKLLLMGDPEQVVRCQEAAQARLGSQVAVARSYPTYLEVTSPGVGKGTGLRALARCLGIPLPEVMAVGDGQNDVDMITIAGLGVAMGHASEEVRAAARFVTASNDQDGLALAIEHWALG